MNLSNIGSFTTRNALYKQLYAWNPKDSEAEQQNRSLQLRAVRSHFRKIQRLYKVTQY